MSLRDHSAPSPPAVDRLAAVLAIGALKLDDGNDVPTDVKRGRSDPIEGLGLSLDGHLEARSLIPPETRLARRLATVELRRSNYGGRGVVFNDVATVLIIGGEHSKYANSYLDYVQAVQNGVSTTNLPRVAYELPIAGEMQNSLQYVQQSRRRMVSLSQAASANDFSFVHEQPFSKVFVFFKLPVSRDRQKEPTGSYVFFGRFRVDTGLKMQFRDTLPMFVHLVPFDIPRVAMPTPRRAFLAPRQPVQDAEKVEGDVAQMIVLLVDQAKK